MLSFSRFALFLLFGKVLLRIFIGTLRDVEARESFETCVKVKSKPSCAWTPNRWSSWLIQGEAFWQDPQFGIVKKKNVTASEGAPSISGGDHTFLGFLRSYNRQSWGGRRGWNLNQWWNLLFPDGQLGSWGGYCFPHPVHMLRHFHEGHGHKRGTCFVWMREGRRHCQT